MAKKTTKKKTSNYYFGGLKKYSLDEIENEVLNESIYLDVFAGSDLRLKESVTEVSQSLEKIKKLDVISFKWKQRKSPRPEVGVVAQQIAVAFPELVRKDKSSGMLAVNYAKLSSHLLVAVKELSAQLEEQETRIQKLEKKLNK